MQQLTRISSWRQRWFTPDSMPSVNTIKKWIDSGIVDGEVIAGNYYIYDAIDTPLAKRPPKGASDLVYQYMQRLNEVK